MLTETSDRLQQPIAKEKMQYEISFVYYDICKLTESTENPLSVINIFFTL